MINKPLMKCGHIANGTTIDGKPYCVICNCGEIADKKPNLNGRKAKCFYCGKITESNENLPFFEYKPNEEFDFYYDGCFGWD